MRADCNVFWVRTCCGAFENCHCKLHLRFGMRHPDMKKNRRCSAGGVSEFHKFLQMSWRCRAHTAHDWESCKLGPLTFTPNLCLVWRFPGPSLQQSSAWMDVWLGTHHEGHTIKRLVKMRAVLSLDESFPICRARISNRTGPIFFHCLPKRTRFQVVRCTLSSSATGLPCGFLKFSVNCSCEFGAGSNVDAAFISIQLIHQRVDPVAFNGLVFSFDALLQTNKYFGKRGCQLFATLKWPAQNRRLQAIGKYVPWEIWEYVQIFCALTSVRFWRPCHFGVRPQPIVDENQKEHFFNYLHGTWLQSIQCLPSTAPLGWRSQCGRPLNH